ncbi:hypothetical protein COOONC_28702 [Cooperia oncophora]
MPREKSTSRRFNVTAASLDAFVTQLCFLRRFRGKMNRSPVYVKSKDVADPALTYDSPISTYFTRSTKFPSEYVMVRVPFKLNGKHLDEDPYETSTPSSKRLQQVLHLDLSPILDSDGSLTSVSDRSSKVIDGVPPSPRNSGTPKSTGRSRIARLAISPRSDNEPSPKTLRTPGRDGDGSYLQTHEVSTPSFSVSFSYLIFPNR